MAPQYGTEGVWVRKEDFVEPPIRRNKKGKKNLKKGSKKFVALEVDFTCRGSQRPADGGDSLTLVTVPRDGYCLFHSVLRAQASYSWGDPSLTLNKLIRLAELEATENKDNYIHAFENTDSDNYVTLLKEYLNHGKFDSVMGDIMPAVLSNSLNLSINIEDGRTGNLIVVQPSNPKYLPVNEIKVRLSGKHYEPYLATVS